MPSDKPVSKASEHRRSNKPIMEKKRRARINNCLNELKNLLLEAMRKDPARHSKLEKADILEMTVKHLQHLQRQQMALAVAADPGVVTKYRAGFNECAEEVSRYVDNLEGIDSPVKQRLLNHLTNCINGLQGVATVGAGHLTSNAGSTAMPRIQLIQSRLANGEIALLLPNRAMANWQMASQQHSLSLYEHNGGAVVAGPISRAVPPTVARVSQQEKGFPRGRTSVGIPALLAVNVDYAHDDASRSSPTVTDDMFSPSPGHSPDSFRSNSLSPASSDCSDHFRMQHPDLPKSCGSHYVGPFPTVESSLTGWNAGPQQRHSVRLARNPSEDGATRNADLCMPEIPFRFEKWQNISVRRETEPELLMPVDLSKDADKMWRPW